MSKSSLSEVFAIKDLMGLQNYRQGLYGDFYHYDKHMNIKKMIIDACERFYQMNVNSSDRKDEGLHNLFNRFFPMQQKKKGILIEYLGYEITPSRLTSEQCVYHGVSYIGMLSIKLKITNIKDNNSRIVDHIAGEIPLITDDGIVVMNGNKRVVLFELVRSPGIAFTKEEDAGYEDMGSVAKVFPMYGLWMHFAIDHHGLYVKIDKNSRFSPLLLLKCFPKDYTNKDIPVNENAYSTKEILSEFYDVLNIKISNGLAKIYIQENLHRHVGIPVNLYDKEGKKKYNAGDLIIDDQEDNKSKSNYYCPVEELGAFYLAEDLIIENKQILAHTRPISEIRPEEWISIKSINVYQINDHNAPYMLKGFAGNFPGRDKHGKNTYINEITREQVILLVSKLCRISSPYGTGTVVDAFENRLFNTCYYNFKEIGRYQLNKALNIKETAHHITYRDLVSTLKELHLLHMGKRKPDNIDSLKKKIVLQFDDIMERYFQANLVKFKKQIYERSYSFKNNDELDITGVTSITTNVVNNIIKISHLFNNLNAFASIAQKTKIDSTGKMGANSRVPTNKRNIDPTQFGLIGPYNTPEGKKVGVINYLAIYARINKLGMLEGPYYPVKNGKVIMKMQYLNAYDLDNKVIGDVSMYSYITKKGEKILQANSEYVMSLCDGYLEEVKNTEVDYVMIANNQIGSFSTSLVVRHETNDTYRSMVAANMNLQAVPNYYLEPPIVSTGMDRYLGDIIRSPVDGKVVRVDNKRILILDNDGILHTKELLQYQKTNGTTAINHHPRVHINDVVKKGDHIADGFTTKDGELALGTNLTVMFTSGMATYEDSCVLSDAILHDYKLLSPRIHSYVCQVIDTKVGHEIVTRSNIPHASNIQLSHLDESGIAMHGTQVKPGDILVGKITPVAENKHNIETNKIVKSLIKDYRGNVKDTSLRVASGVSGTVIKVEILTSKDVAKDDRAVLNDRTLSTQYHQELITNLNLTKSFFVNHISSQKMKNKKLILEIFEKVNHEEYRDSEKILMQMKGLMSDKQYEIFKRYVNNISIIYKRYDEKIRNIQEPFEMAEDVLKTIRVYVAESHRISTGDKLAGRCGNKSVVSEIIPACDMPYLEDGTIVDLKMSSLGILSRMNNGQLFEAFIGYAVEKLRYNIRKLLKKIRLEIVNLQNVRNELETLVDYASGAHIHKNILKAKNMSDDDLLNVAKRFDEKGIYVKIEQFHHLKKDQIKKMLEDLGCIKYEKVHVYHGTTGEKSMYPVVVGKIYMMKLHHISSNKIHARSTGPIAQTTLQPVYGKSKRGGQRFGEMEVWAVQANGASYILQELLTYKSDDLIGKMRMVRHIIENGNFTQLTGAYRVSESFRNLVAILRSSGFKVDMVQRNGDRIENWEHGKLDPFNSYIDISIATNEDILRWSKGEVKTAETYHYKNFEPVFGGLFDPRIFGTHTNFSCFCGQVTGRKNENVTCSNCEVTVTSSLVTRENLGHINLAIPVIHPLFVRNTDNKVAKILEMTNKDVSSIIDLQTYVVEDPGQTGYSVGDLIPKDLVEDCEEESLLATDMDFKARTGADAIKVLFENLDLQQKVKQLEQKIKKTKSKTMTQKLQKQIHSLKSILRNNTDLSSLIIDKIVVAPASLRPIVSIPGGQIAASELNEKYRVLKMRNNRLLKIIPDLQDTMFTDQRMNSKSLMNEHTEDYNDISSINIYDSNIGSFCSPVMSYDRRLLQDAVNRCIGVPQVNRMYSSKTEQHAAQSLIMKITGKEGMLRRSMLGKRVDFSARSVIIPADVNDVKLDDCMLPRDIALELFKPHITHYLVQSGQYDASYAAMNAIKLKKKIVWDALDEVVKDHVVLLNRAPTLHRLGILGFNVKIWNSNAIGINPAVCHMFNADFDGDQMAVHLSLSDEAIAETCYLTKPSKHLASATHGGFNVYAFKDIILGIYGMMLMNENKESVQFINENHALMAYEQGEIHLMDPIDIQIEEFGKIKTVKTTIGRRLFWNIIPNDLVEFEKYNKPFTNKEIREIMNLIRKNIDDEALTDFVNQMQKIGFKYVAKIMGSFGLEDFIEAPEINKIIEQSKKKIRSYSDHWKEGYLAKEEFYNKCRDISSYVMESCKKYMNEYIVKNSHNPIIKIISSGARGSISNLIQLYLVKGNVQDMKGNVSHTMIFNNHAHGMSLFENCILSSGTRKTTTDVSIRTAESGYLTRKLEDSSQSCIIMENDCQTTNCIKMSNVFRDGVLQSSIYENIKGRVSARSILLEGEARLPKDLLITDQIIDLLKVYDIQEVYIRTPVGCELGIGICAKCYGEDISTGHPVQIGEAVGVIAAQAIGEPGTQLTMRAFHKGGIASLSSHNTQAITPFAGRVVFINSKFVKETINISSNMKIAIYNQRNHEVARFNIPYGANILVKHDKNIEKQTLLAQWDVAIPLISEDDGIIKFDNLIPGHNYDYSNDSETGQQNIIIHSTSRSPILRITNKNGNTLQEIYLKSNTTIFFKDGQKVSKGQILGKKRQDEKAIDIVGGLKRVTSLLDDRSSNKKHVIFSPVSGTISIRRTPSVQVVITESDNKESIISGVDMNYFICSHGQYVSKGDPITSGVIKLQSLLDAQGIDALIHYFVWEMKSIYMENGLEVNIKHLEIILSQMCRNYLVTSGTHKGLEAPRSSIYRTLRVRGKKLQTWFNKNTKRIVQGITNTALSADSFLSSISFQTTIKGIVDASLRKSRDHLQCLKSCTLAGIQQPTGTGLIIRYLNAIAKHDILDDQQKDNEYYQSAMKIMKSYYKNIQVEKKPEENLDLLIDDSKNKIDKNTSL